MNGRRLAAAPALALAFLAAGCAPSGKGLALPGASSSDSATPEAAAPAVAAPGEAKPPEALTESEIPRAAIVAETRIRALRSLASRTHEIESITASSAPVLASVEALKEWMRTRDPGQQTARALRSLGQEWRLDQDLLNGWMDATGRRLDALTAARGELGRLEATWTATAASFSGSLAPPALIERTHAVLASIDDLDGQLRAQVESVLTFQGQISSASLDAEEALESIAATLREEQKSLFKIESPPIWKIFGTSAGQAPLREQLAASVRENVRALRQYAQRSGRAFEIQFGVLVALAILFFRLRRNSRAWPQDEKGVVACTRLVRRPILGAILVTLLVGAWLHPRAPLAFYETSSILLTVPVVLLMRGIVMPRVRGALYLLGVIFVAERIWESTPAGTPIERTLLLGLTALSAGGLVWTIRPPAVLSEVVSRAWWRAVRIAGQVALVALGIAAIANAVGNLTLARLITATVVRAAYWAVVNYAGALLLRGLTTLALRRPELLAIRTIGRHKDVIRRRVHAFVDAFAIACFLLLTLNATGQWSLAWETIDDVLTKPWGIGDTRFSLASALTFVAAVYASILVSRLLCTILEEDVYPRVSLPRGVPGTFTMIVRYGVISIGFLLAASIARIPIDRLAIVLGAFSVGIGFGLQTVVNNFVSGLILMFERPIQVGDTVDVGGLVGRVRHIGVRASRIETFDGAEVIVPNGTLVSNQLINWTLSSRNRRIEIQVGVAYGTDPERVLALLRETVTAHPEVLSHPAPTALFRAFGASSLDFSVYFWTSNFDEWTRVRSDVTVRVHRALGDAGIEIPFPQIDVHTKP